jgi:kumamolisin
MTERFALAGSHRARDTAAHVVGAPNPSDLVEVTLVLRRRAPLDPRAIAQPMHRLAFAVTHGASPDDVWKVEQFAARFALTVGSVDLSRRTINVSGTVAALSEAFGTSLELFQSEQGVYRGRTGDLFLPSDLQEAVVGVFGLDNRPQARPRFRRRPHGTAARASFDRSFTPNEIAALYGAPPGTGRGETIALIELGGGYAASDLQSYFATLGLAAPAVNAVSVGGARNAPTGDPNGADGEVLLDIEVAGAVAPEARIVVYFAPNTDKGFLDAIGTALHDHVRQPSVISISWGGPEPSWTRQALHAYDDAFQDAAALGITVCCAAGDSGSGDGIEDGRAHVDFPASSPHVLACGGTRLEASGGRIEREAVWNEPRGGATGGGVSEVFARPDYQDNANVPPSVNLPHFHGRGVPDVAGNADPATGYAIRVDGHDAVFGGTSAVAPLWAALIARRNEAAGSPLGYANPILYVAATVAGAFRDVTAGDNGEYRSSAGWDPCTGLGSPARGIFGLQPSVTS